MIRIGCIVFTSVFAFSCNNNQSEQTDHSVKNGVDSVKHEVVVKDSCAMYLQKAQTADKKLLTATTFNKVDAENALVAFDTYANFCFKDSLAPVYLLKGGQVAQSIGRYSTAQDLLRRCIANYPKFESRAAALFLLAQLYDNATMLNDETKARVIYQQLLEEYPKTTFAEDAKTCLKNLGKTDEQLIEEFLKKNK